MQVLSRVLADLPALSAVIATVLAEPYIDIGAAKDAIPFTQAFGFRKPASGAEIRHIAPWLI